MHIMHNLSPAAIIDCSQLPTYCKPSTPLTDNPSTPEPIPSEWRPPPPTALPQSGRRPHPPPPPLPAAFPSGQWPR